MIANLWTDWLGAIANLIVAGVAVFALWVGSRKVDAWRREARGRDEYGYASRILQAVYKVRDAISRLRMMPDTSSVSMEGIFEAQSAVIILIKESEAWFADALDGAYLLMAGCSRAIVTAQLELRQLGDDPAGEEYEKLLEILEISPNLVDEDFSSGVFSYSVHELNAGDHVAHER